MNPTNGVIGDSWELYKKHWRHLAPIALIVYIVLGVVAALLAAVFDNWLAGLLSAMIGIIGAFWLQGALVKAVADVRDGRADMSIRDTFASAWPHVPAVAIAGILAGLGIALGLLLLIVPGLVLMTWWVVIIPAIVLEDKSAAESFSRSRELVAPGAPLGRDQRHVDRAVHRRHVDAPLLPAAEREGAGTAATAAPGDCRSLS
jgi:small-conductance mechanosensitive channel